MKFMNRQLLSLFTIMIFGLAQAQDEYITNQGQVSFFSYTSVEDIEAINNQALSVFYPETGQIGARILMRAFTFEKSLMYEHFNESYIESDLYPTAFFQGEIINFDPLQEGSQTKIIKGDFTLRDITTPLQIKAKITKENTGYTISGELEVLVDDYKIKIPAILSPNIAKNIKISFNFQYDPNDNQK